MSFANNIRSNAVPEWKDFYVDYEELRSKMKHKDYRQLLSGELTKINNFYFLLEKKSVDEKNKIFDDVFTELPDENYEDLRAQTECTDEDSDSTHASNSSFNESHRSIESDTDFKRVSKISDKMTKNVMNGDERRKLIHDDNKSIIDNNALPDQSTTDVEERSSSESTWKQRQLQIEASLKKFMKMPRAITRRKKEKNITEFLHSLIKITAYRDLNSSALLKLAKRYANIKKNPKFFEEFSQKVKSSYFYKSQRIERIRAAIKKLYKRMFAKNEPEKARAVFNRIKRGIKSSDWLFILSGLFIGISITIGLIFKSPWNKGNDTFWGITSIYIGFILFGFCLKVFKYLQINYKYIFNFDVSSSMNNSLYLVAVSSLLILNVSTLVIIDSLAAREKIVQTTIEYCESICIALQLLIPMIPCDILFYNSRIYLLGVFAHAVFRPLSTVRFRHFYFIDVAQSFAFSFKEILKSLGVMNPYILTAFVSMFPIIRILQSLKRYTASKIRFPHLMSCAKFSLAILFGASRVAEIKHDHFITISILLGILNTLFGLFWDLFMDWQIMRSRYIYSKAAYVVIISFNILTRFLWTVKYLFGHDRPVFEGIAEIIRRFLWTLVRVEAEHLNNCDELKTKNIINLTAGELFYKKDQDEAYVDHSGSEMEIMDTDDEIENKHNPNNVSTESETDWDPESCDEMA